MAKTIPKPTIDELRLRRDIPPETVEEIERLMIRLVQIKDEIHKLEAEQGYTETYTKIRHPGLQDQLENLLIKHSLPGVKLSEYTGLWARWSYSRIDGILLSNLGVDGQTITQATVTDSGLAFQLRKNKGKGKGADTDDE
jgi:hypothetical protein